MGNKEQCKHNIVYSNGTTWVCKDCGYEYPKGTRFRNSRPTGSPTENSESSREYLGYRGRLEDPYEQEAFDYEHEGYREMDDWI